MNGTLIAAGTSLEKVRSKKPVRLLHCLTILITPQDPAYIVIMTRSSENGTLFEILPINLFP